MSDNPQAEKPRGSSYMERMFDHVLRALTVAALIGGSVTLWSVSKTVAVMEARFNDFQIAMVQLYEKQLEDHEDRIRKLEAK